MLKPRLDLLVRSRFDVSWGKARGWIETGKIFVNDAKVTDPGALTDESARIELKMNAPRSRTQTDSGPPLSKSEIVHLDSQLIVIDKPSGISTVPFEEGEKGSLEQKVSDHLKQRVSVVHRLDRETSGLIVFARTTEAAKSLANQFRFHTVHRRYLALAHGDVPTQTIRSLLIENRGDGLRGSIPPGSSIPKHLAKEAITHVRALRNLGAMTLIECRLETGRTHQIRIHLSEAGHPLVGEKAYIREFSGERIEAPRIMLHAAELGFEHPSQGVRMNWKSELPEAFRSFTD
jgi:23S rRNA pseudouridine1911/1915/1917 synthase